MKRPLLAFTALLAAALLLMLPLRLALKMAGLDAAGLSAQAVSGSLWSGRMTAAGWRGIALGDGSAGLSPLALLTGRVRLGWAGDTIGGTIVRHRGGGGVEGVSGRTGAMTIGGLGLQSMEFAGVDIGFADGRCSRAGGQVSLQPAGALALAGSLTGIPRCAGEALVLPLVSADGSAQIELRARADASYRATITLEPVAEAARPGLLAAGFQPTPQGVAMTVEGVL